MVPDRARSTLPVIAAIAFVGIPSASVLAPLPHRVGTPSRSSPVESAAAATRLLCGPARGSLERLLVRRVNSLPQNRPHFSFPALVTVRTSVGVARVARALCRLPAMPSGVLHCPADFGITYTLEFSARAGSAAVEVDASGCESVRGLAPMRHVVASAFWSTLGAAMGIGPATQQSFLGRLPL